MQRDLSASAVEKTKNEKRGLIREARRLLATLAERDAKFIQKVRSGRRRFEDVNSLW